MDNPLSVAFNQAAPRDERSDAERVATRAAMPAAIANLMPNSAIQPFIDYIKAEAEEQAFNKSLSHTNVIPFPSTAIRDHKPGMQSVYLDDMQILVQGDYYEKPTMFGFDSMRSMVEQTPILNAIVMTRVRQVSRFCRANESGKGPGFKITTKERGAHVSSDNKKVIATMQTFFTNCGMETNPRQRKRLKRDNFHTFMAKQVRDTLTMDSAPIETEFKRNKANGIDGMYAVDGATVRLCTEEGYQGDDEIFALQVVQGQIRACYGYDDLIYEPRNPRSDVMVGGYGLGEAELLIRVVTGFLNAFNYNTSYFDKNSLPKGMMNLYGDYAEEDISAFKRYWKAMTQGSNNAWTMPVMISKNMESKAEFSKFDVDQDDAMFTKWMTFLASIACAIYSISPEEINFESFTNGTSSLSGSDTEEKLESSKDKGLRPLLSYFEETYSDFIVASMSEDYVFRYTGLDDEDDDRVFETKKLLFTVNEWRAEMDMPKITEQWGEAPINPSLLSAWQAEQQANADPQGGMDFGQPQQPGQPSGSSTASGAQGGQQQQPSDGNDFGSAPAETPDDDDKNLDDTEMTAKSFGLPIYTIGG